MGFGRMVDTSGGKQILQDSSVGNFETRIN
jgi:hypothetical protein